MIKTQIQIANPKKVKKFEAKKYYHDYDYMYSSQSRLIQFILTDRPRRNE